MDQKVKTNYFLYIQFITRNIAIKSIFPQNNSLVIPESGSKLACLQVTTTLWFNGDYANTAQKIQPINYYTKNWVLNKSDKLEI